MSTRRVILFAIAFILLIIVIVNPFPKRTATVDTVVPIPVMVAAHDLPPFTILTEDDVRSDRLPPSVAADSFGEAQSMVGMMTTGEVRLGSIVHRSEVLSPDPNWVDGDMLVFSFYVSTSRIVGGQLRPGHHIDLLVTRAETNDQLPESLWLAQNLWVVGVYQASGDEVSRPSVVVLADTPEAAEATSGAFGFAASSAQNARSGPANLVVVAARRQVASMVGDYLGARSYEPWVYVRPGQLAGQSALLNAQIDGVVYHDKDRDLLQQRSDPGIDGVAIRLLGEDGNLVETATTISGGRFSFGDLQPGTYTVVEEDHEGYVSVSPNTIQVAVVEGQNLHVEFADAKPEAGDSAAGAEQTVVPATAAPTAVPSPQATAIASAETGCQCQVYISDAEGGAPVVDLAENTSSVWAVIHLDGCAEGTAYAVVTNYAATGDKEQIVSSGTWNGSSDTVSVRIQPSSGSVFVPGAYVTSLRTGTEQAACDMAWWYVAVTHTPDGTIQPQQTPGLPVTGAGENDGEPYTGFGFSRGR